MSWLGQALFRRTYRRVQCQHLGARGIYGDEINLAGGHRGYCPSCRTTLGYIPTSIHTLAGKRRRQ